MSNPAASITTALSDIKELCEKATPTNPKIGEPATCQRKVDDIRDMHIPVFWSDSGTAAHFTRKEDAELYAASRETVERLVKFAEHQEETIRSIINSDWMFHFRSLHKYLESRRAESAVILTGAKP